LSEEEEEASIQGVRGLMAAQTHKGCLFSHILWTHVKGMIAI